MTLKEMQSCADETLAFFVQTMPGVPFGVGGVDIVFAPRKEMAAQWKTFAEQYAPERLRTLENHHFEQLENRLFGNAIVGREKSAAILRRDYKMEWDNLRRIVFHELMHLYCAKTEMDGEHFIDVYGSGHTPDPDPENKIYDGQVSAGYAVWSEFIAEYFATIKTAPNKHYFNDIVGMAFHLLGDVNAAEESAKYCFAMMSAYILSCADAREAIEDINEISDGSPNGETATLALQDCLVFLYDHVQGKQPCKITEEFIHEFGCKYLMFLIRNSVYLGAMGQV